MSEKKVVSRNLAIILGVVIIILLAGLVGAIANYTSITNDKDNTISSKNSQISDLQNQISSKDSQINSLNSTVKSLEASLEKNETQLAQTQTLLSQTETYLQGNLTKNAVLNSQITSLESQISSLNSQITSLQNQISTLNAQITSLQNQVNTLTTLSIGTTLETYYEYVRLNCYTVGFQPVGEENWANYPNYYNISVTFAADEAAHDIGNLWWPTLEGNYPNYTGEYSYQTSSRIMQKAMTLANISSSDSNTTKIDKVLAFISSNVHYEHRLLDHMWFPCETLTFHSGDCTSFSILAAAMLEESGIKSAIGFFTNSTLGGHAMVLVHLDNLGSHAYWYYNNLTGYKLTSGKWIIIEPQCASLTQQDANLNWIGYWTLQACAEVPYGP
jgi:prefoldin subunit 5